MYQYSETNVMHFLFNILRINGIYMFRASLTHPQEVVHKRHLVYCVREFHSNPGSSQLTEQARNIPSAACEPPPEDE
jgi:hypothetical protein